MRDQDQGKTLENNIRQEVIDFKVISIWDRDKTESLVYTSVSRPRGAKTIANNTCPNLTWPVPT